MSKLKDLNDGISIRIEWSNEREYFPKIDMSTWFSVPPLNPFVFGPDYRVESVIFELKEVEVKHSDYFIDFIVKEFGNISKEMEFKDMVLSYEMYFDVIDAPTRWNFKLRFYLEKKNLEI